MDTLFFHAFLQWFIYSAMIYSSECNGWFPGKRSVDDKPGQRAALPRRVLCKPLLKPVTQDPSYSLMILAMSKVLIAHARLVNDGQLNYADGQIIGGPGGRRLVFDR